MTKRVVINSVVDYVQDKHHVVYHAACATIGRDGQFIDVCPCLYYEYFVGKKAYRWVIFPNSYGALPTPEDALECGGGEWLEVGFEEGFDLEIE